MLIVDTTALTAYDRSAVKTLYFISLCKAVPMTTPYSQFSRDAHSGRMAIALIALRPLNQTSKLKTVTASQISAKQTMCGKVSGSP